MSNEKVAGYIVGSNMNIEDPYGIYEDYELPKSRDIDNKEYATKEEAREAYKNEIIKQHHTEEYFGTDTLTYAFLERMNLTVSPYVKEVYENGTTSDPKHDYFSINENYITQENNTGEVIVKEDEAPIWNTKTCESMKNIGFPIDKETIIGCCAFKERTDISSIDFNGVSYIGLAAFNRCSELKEIDLSSVKIIDGGAFMNCENLQDVKLPEDLTNIPDYTFANSGIEFLEMPESVTSIGKNALFNCRNLKEIDLSNCVSIGKSAFAYCTSLEKIVIPDSVKYIDKGAFWGCENLSEIEISDQLLGNIGPYDIENVFGETNLDLEAMKEIAYDYQRNHPELFPEEYDREYNIDDSDNGTEDEDIDI